MRPARAFRFIVPSRSDVAARLEELIAGEASRSEVSEWATEFSIYENPQIYPEVRDEVVWDALMNLMAADLRNAPDEYFHSEEDFKDWLAELRTAP